MHACRLRRPGVQMRLLRSHVLRTRPALPRSRVPVPVHVHVLDYDYESEKLPPLLSLAFAGNLFIPRISAKRSECCRPSAVVNHSTFPPQILKPIHAQGGGGFSAISDGRSPGKTPSIGGDSRGKDKSHSHEGAQKHTKRDLGWHPFLWFFVPFCGHSPLPVIRTVFNVFFPRISAKRSECCRPSVVADRSTFPPRLLQLHPRTGGRRFFSD